MQTNPLSALQLKSYFSIKKCRFDHLVQFILDFFIQLMKMMHTGESVGEGSASDSQSCFQIVLIIYVVRSHSVDFPRIIYPDLKNSSSLTPPRAPEGSPLSSIRSLNLRRFPVMDMDTNAI